MFYLLVVALSKYRNKQVGLFHMEVAQSIPDFNEQHCGLKLRTNDKHIESFLKSLNSDFSTFNFDCAAVEVDNEKTFKTFVTLRDQVPDQNDAACRKTLFNGRLLFGHACVWK